MSKKIKVVFGMGDFFVGGAQRQFSEQIKYFDHDRFEIILITLFQSTERADLYKTLPPDLEVHTLSFSGFMDLQSWLKLYRLLRQIRPDIVVSSFFFGNTVLRILKPFIGYISVAREHNTYTYKTKWHCLLDRVLSHLSYCIVAVSNEVADFTSEQEGIPRTKFEVIHNGVDTVRIQQELETIPDRDSIRIEFGIPPADIVLLTVARLTPQKNHKLLIDSFAKFHTLRTNSTLVLVGDGSLRKTLEQYATEKGISDKVVFFGMQSDVLRFYKMADVFASTSDIEGLSNAYLEALAVGLPLVVTRTGGTDEIVIENETGVLIDERNPQVISDGIERALRIDSSEHASERRAQFCATFDIQIAVRNYEHLFEDIYSYSKRSGD